MRMESGQQKRQAGRGRTGGWGSFPSAISSAHPLQVVSEGDPLVFLDTDGAAPDSRSGSSSCNPGESAVVLSCLEALIASGMDPSDAAIISPYRSQVSALSRAVGKLGASAGGAEVLTIDKSQVRRESALCRFCLAPSRPCPSPCILPGYAFLHSLPPRSHISFHTIFLSRLRPSPPLSFVFPSSPFPPFFPLCPPHTHPSAFFTPVQFFLARLSSSFHCPLRHPALPCLFSPCPSPAPRRVPSPAHLFSRALVFHQSPPPPLFNRPSPI